MSEQGLLRMENMSEREAFIQFLQVTTEAVKQWPTWKQQILGGSLSVVNARQAPSPAKESVSKEQK